MGPTNDEPDGEPGQTAAESTAEVPPRSSGEMPPSSGETPPWPRAETAPPVGPNATPTPPGFSRTDRRDGSWVGGVILIVLGIAFLVGQLLPNAGQYVPLLVGLSFLAVFLATRNYGFLVPGGIVTGVGVGIVLATEDQGRVGGGLFLISLGLGFIAIYLLAALFRIRENHPWPFIPGGILVTVGVVTLAGTRYGEIARYIWPAALIVLGLAFVIRGLVRRPPA
jgi:hypothetical protein